MSLSLFLPLSYTEVLALKHQSRILGQWSNPVSGPSQFSMGQTAQSLTCYIMENSDGNWENCLDQRFTSQLSGKKVCPDKHGQM